jgi:two-component system sensor histidine kinase CpxA
MRSLFVKIFLWFWVGMALVSVVSLLSAMATESSPLFATPWLRFLVRQHIGGQLKTEPGSFTSHWTGVMGNCVRLAGQSAVEIYERDGKTALHDYLNQLQEAAHIHIFLFEENDGRIAGGPVPEDISELTSHLQGDGLDFKRSGESIFMAQQLTGSHNNKYTLIAGFPAQHFITRNHSFVAINLIFIIITGGGVCYWLARYISRPICQLGAAARRLADGDLKTRVGEVLGKRRDEIAELGQDFDLMAERIESLMTSQRRLLRDISHEFRSPLTRLTLALEIARRQGGQDAVNALARIELEADRLNALIGSLLMLARLESGTEEVDGTPINMGELIEDLVDDAAFEGSGRNCTVHLVSTENCIVQGSGELLRSAVENVLRNAINYTAENTEVTVALRCEMEANALRAVIEVRDNGPGVPEEALANLFYPFYRVGDARDRKQGGTGLGLAITERAARLHGGAVKAANAPGGGLVITITLPAASLA